MAKEELFSTRFSSWWMRSVGCVPVKRDSNDFAALRVAMRRLGSGEGLFLFPEGSRQERGAELAQPQAGIGFLAAKLNVPVVPAFVKGTDKALPKGAKFMRPVKVFVCFGEQIHIEKGMPYEEAASLIMKKIRHLAS
jgi:1-acyl-sn-glycerol-3-phosphate acyltransferase